MKNFGRYWGVLALALILSFSLASSSYAAKAAEIDQKVDEALAELYRTSPAAVELSKIAKGVLVFPRITKAGFVVGGLVGTGALRVDGKTMGYYRIVAGSYGLQAGVQVYSLALFFVTQDALDYLEKSKGWEIGVGPSVVVVDKGFAKSFTTTTAKSDIYAFFFNQKGLMAGLGLQGSKITEIHPE